MMNWIQYPDRLNMKMHLKKVAISMLLLFFPMFKSYAADLYVYVPSSETAATIQEKMQVDCPGVTVSAFGRVKDFGKKIVEAKPAGILSLLPVIEQHADFKVSTRGIVAGSDSIAYVYVSVDKGVDAAAADAMKLGVIDILGRKEMKVYLNDMFGKPVSTKRVTKIDDLIPLLTFNAVEALFIDSATFEEIKKSTELKLVATPSPHKLGLTLLAVSDPGQADGLKKCVTSLSPAVNKIMGVESWK